VGAGVQAHEAIQPEVKFLIWDMGLRYPSAPRARAPRVGVRTSQSRGPGPDAFSGHRKEGMQTQMTSFTFPARIEFLERRQLLSAILRPDHIVVVVEEDRFANAVGDTTNLPYFNSQIATGGLVYTASTGVTTPGLPNYLSLFAGSTLGITDNGNNHTFSNANIAKSLNSTLDPSGHYMSFVGYSENLPHDGDMTTQLAGDPSNPSAPPDTYIRAYNPMAQFTDDGSQNGVAIANSAVNKTFASFPTTTAGYAALPTVSYVIPNTSHNTHGSNEQSPWATDPGNYAIFRKNADAWLKAHLDGYLQWAKANNSLLIVTEDEVEHDYKTTTTISTVIAGDPRLVIPGTNNQTFNHFNLVRTIEDMYGLPLLGSTATAADFTVNAGGQLSPFPVQNPQIATTTGLSSNAASAVYGQNVTFTAQVTSSSGVPSGTVTFMDGATTLSSSTLNSSGIATYSTTALSGGSHSITAVYGGDATHQTSTSAVVGETISRAGTTLSLGTSTNSTVFGQSLTLTATISIVSPGAGTPGGTVTFLDGSTTIGTGSVNAATNQATLTISSLAVGGHSITASYAGDTNFVGSTSSSVTDTVSQASTTTTLAATTATVYGQSVSFSATVAPVSPGAGTPTGSIQFVIDSVNFGSLVTLVNGSAVSAATNLLSVASHSIVAMYLDDANFTTSTSAAATQVVNAAATTTTVVSSASPASVGQSITFTATVAAAPPGAGTPSGTVQFMLDNAAFGSPVALVNGSATSGSISTLTSGSHTVSAVYSGDSNFTGSTSNTLSQQVGVPANDAFASSIPLTGLTVSTTGTNVNATKEVGEPNHAGNAGGVSVWWNWTAPLNGTVTIDTAGSTFDTLLAVYTGTAVNALTAVTGGSNDNAGTGIVTSKVSFAVTAGKVYQIAVDGASAASGAIALNINEVPVAPAAPTAVTASDNTFTDGVHVSWTAPLGATAYEVWRNTTNKSNTATKVSTTDVITTNYIDTTAVAGKTYYYWLKAKNTGGTSGFSAADPGIRATVALTNDLFANATVISGPTVSLTGSNVGATKEAGEPSIIGNAGGKSVWYVWTAPSAGTVTIDTLGSSFDTLLAVYTGTSVSSLTTIAANDDSPAGGTTTSKVTFTAIAGTTYHITIDGYSGVSGNFALHLSLV
jgi:hypothetical protein